MPHPGNDRKLELALHLANHQLAIKPLRAGEHEQARRSRSEEELRERGEPTLTTRISININGLQQGKNVLVQ